MRKLIRILAGVVLISAVLAVNASSALAEHGVGTGTPDPISPPVGVGVPGDDAAGWNEEQPDFAIAEIADPCVVTGTVDPGAPFENNAHFVNVPLVNDDPSHSHFEFLNTIINCFGAGALGVNADGGNDGHSIDILCGPSATSSCGGTPLEADIDDQDHLGICSTVHPDLCMGTPNTDLGAQHEFNGHHGSVNESGWSHSAGYSGPGGPAVGFESNDCTPDDPTNTRNKADIAIVQPTAVVTDGWVKYIRVGVVVYAWGCVDLPMDANDVFSAVLVILPNLLPADPTGTFPAGLLSPICPLEDVTGPPAAPCGFILAGVAWRGPDWLDPEP